jgi:hypothetical protein
MIAVPCVRLAKRWEILVAGYTFNAASTPRFALVATRCGRAGWSFGSGGKVTTSIDVNSYVKGVAVQGDGKILVAGYTFLTMAPHFHPPSPNSFRAWSASVPRARWILASAVVAR